MAFNRRGIGRFEISTDGPFSTALLHDMPNLHEALLRIDTFNAARDFPLATGQEARCIGIRGAEQCNVIVAFGRGHDIKVCIRSRS